MTTSTRLIILIVSMAISSTALTQVTIGMGEAPSRTALLQLKSQAADADNVTSTKGGILLPRVKLVSLTTLEPFISTTDPSYAQEKSSSVGLLVYNMTESSTADLYPGIYAWNGTKWELPSTSTRSVPTSGTSSGSGAIKINVNQTNFATLTGTQSYGLLMQNQGINTNPQYATGVYPNGTTTGDPYSILTSTVGNNGNDEAFLLEAPGLNKANFYRMNMQFVMGNNPPAATKYFDVLVVSVSTGALVYRNSVVVPGGLNTGHVAYFQIFFPTIADAASIGSGYRIIFNVDTAASQGLQNNIGIKVVDVTRIN